MSPKAISSESLRANVECAITCVSPVRPTNYFEGEKTDGEALLRFVWFDKNKRDEIYGFYKTVVLKKSNSNK